MILLQFTIICLKVIYINCIHTVRMLYDMMVYGCPSLPSSRPQSWVVPGAGGVLRLLPAQLRPHALWAAANSERPPWRRSSRAVKPHDGPERASQLCFLLFVCVSQLPPL